MDRTSASRPGPVAPVTLPVAAADAVGPRYDSPRLRARWAVVALFVVILAMVFQIAADFLEIATLDRGMPEGDVPAANAVRQLIVSLFWLVTYIASAVVFSMWFHRAYRNLPALGARDLLSTPGWVVGSFYIPILNLFRPFQAAREIAVYSDPDQPAGQLAQDVGAPAMVKCWWATWIIGNLLLNTASRATSDQLSPETFEVGRMIEDIARIVLIGAALLAVAVVNKISRDQDARRARLKTG